MARIKPKDKLPQLQSWDDVNLALCEIAEHMRVTESIQHKMQQVIEDAKLQAKDACDPHAAAIDALSRQIKEYAERNRDSLKKKTKPLVFGNIGWRKSTKLTLPRDPGKVADIVRLLRALGWNDCIKVEPPKVNREALRTHPIEDIIKVGVDVSVTDEFWLEVKKDAIPAEPEVQDGRI